MPKRPVDTDLNRICSQCGTSKERTAEYFRPSKQCLGGLSGWCRECSNTYSKNWKSLRSDSQKTRRRELYASRPGARAAYEKRLAAEQWKSNPARKRAILLVEGMRSRSKINATPFNNKVYTISFMAAWLSAYPECPCCGSRYKLEPGGCLGPSDRSPSVDQIVPGGGYVAGNVALLCWRCNNLKRDASVAELEGVVRWMRDARSSTPSKEDITSLLSWDGVGPAGTSANPNFIEDNTIGRGVEYAQEGLKNADASGLGIGLGSDEWRVAGP